MDDDRLGPDFSAHEFRCRCGKCGLGAESMRDVLLRQLVLARRITATPFVITSAIRCPAHNAAVGGVDNSAHVSGYAVDVAVESSVARYQIVLAALNARFNRIGVASRFVHLDCDPDKAAEVIWTY